MLHFYIIFGFSLMAFMLSFLMDTLCLDISLSFLGVSNFPVSFLLSSYGCLFSGVVTLTTSCVILHSLNYLELSMKSNYYISLVYMFMASMLLVINLSNLFFLMLGWDGLGIISFFLIMFYNNKKSLFAGIYSLVMNRIGDSFPIIGMILYVNCSSELNMITSSNVSFTAIVLMLLAFMTKTAILPFSSWLPIATAAPTPISALVHSSTLVTAGLFLMMRFNYIFHSHLSLLETSICLGSLTSLCAGLASLTETDFKKLIALSTLSHLGFILFAFALGFLNLAFFHLIAHALFKSLLFLSFGGMMLDNGHNQDKRVMGMMGISTPISSLFMLTSVSNLAGLPSFSGFYSKDLILELFYNHNSSLMLLAVLYMNVFLTYIYTYKLMGLQCKGGMASPLCLSSTFWGGSIMVPLFFLGTFSILFGQMFLNSLALEETLPAEEIKILVIYLNLSGLFLLFLNEGTLFGKNGKKFSQFIMSGMVFMSYLHILGNKIILSVLMSYTPFTPQLMSKSFPTHTILKMPNLSNFQSILLLMGVVMLFLV